MSESRAASHQAAVARNIGAAGEAANVSLLALSAMTCAFVNYGLQIWAATFLHSAYTEWREGSGMKLGIASAVGLSSVPSAPETLADRFGRLGYPLDMRVTGAGMLLAMPFGLLALMNSTANASFV